MGARLNGRGDLVAGCVAVGTLAFLVLVLRLPLFLAAVLAAATYCGFSFLRSPASSRSIVPWDAFWRLWARWPANDIREATADEQVYATAFARTQALRALTSRIVKPAVHSQITLILDRVDQIMRAMADDRDLDQIPVLDSCLLEPLLELLSIYLRLAERRVQIAGDLLEKIESVDLPLIEQAVNDFYERLHQGQVIDLATLSEMLEFNLERVRATTRRRKTL